VRLFSVWATTVMMAAESSQVAASTYSAAVEALFSGL
jgi:hypothetical protein